MNALVVGFDVEETRRLSHELRVAGHQVLGAVGKQGAWTFLRAIQPDVVIVPTGMDGERARGWVAEVGGEVAFVSVASGGDAAARLARFVRGEPIDEFVAEPPDVPTADVDALEPEAIAAPDEDMVELVHEVVALPPELLPAPHLEVDERDALAGHRPGRVEVSDEEGQPREPHPDLVSKLAQVRFGDYHSILEVEPGGSPYAVREQRDRLARRFSPRGWPGRLHPEEIDILNEISRGIGDAFLILSDPELAMRYERALAAARPAASPDVPR